MRSKIPTRRSFLKSTLAGTATVGAAALPLNASPAPGKSSAQKKIITRPGQPLTAESVLSPATQIGNLLFLSGSGAHEPSSHKVVSGPIGNQVKQCLDNLKTILEAAGSSMDKVLKCTVFLNDIGDFAAMNEAYHSYFPSNPPARTTVAVKDLPGASPVEIECIAYV
jgi:2-iminobutanoate/2-iminopropanoate deaminase